MYEAKKNIDKLKNGEATFFLDPNLEKEIVNKFKGDINIFRPYEEAERIIIYRDLKPRVSLFKIITKEKLRHQDIMGSILSLNIKKEVLGDIIVDDNNYYFYILESMNNYILSYFNKVRNINVSLEELPLNYLKDYKRKYKEIIVNVKSNSSLICTPPFNLRITLSLKTAVFPEPAPALTIILLPSSLIAKLCSFVQLGISFTS